MGHPLRRGRAPRPIAPLPVPGAARGVRATRAALTLLAGLLLGMLPGGRWAAAAEILIESPAFSYDPELNRYRYEGAHIEVGAVRMDADVIVIDADAARIEASGRVRFQDGKITGSAQRAEMDTETGIATLHHAEVYDAGAGYFLRGETLIRTGEETYQGEQCELTNCRPGEGGWHIYAGSIDYTLNAYALGYNSSFWLGSTPVFWTPILGWPTVEQRRSGFLAPAVGGTYTTKDRFNLGTTVRVPYFLDLGFDQDLTIMPEYFWNRGTGLNLEYNYAFAEQQKGQLRFFGISESVPRNLHKENILEGVDLANEDRTPDRYWTTYGHNQAFTERTQLVARMAQTSDGQVLREYENIREYRPALDYQAGLSHQDYWGNSAVTAAHTSEYTEESLFADSSAFTDGNLRPQLLPRISYNGGWQPSWRVPLGLELAGAVTRFITVDGASGRAEEATPAVSLPLRLFGSAELRPTVARRFLSYDALEVDQSVFAQAPAERPRWLRDAEALGAEAGFSQSAYEVELRMPFARRFDLSEGRWAALKHRLIPRLIYRELEDVPQPLTGLLIPPEPALKLVTFRLDNELLGLPRGSNSGLGSGIADLNLIQRYNVLLENPDFQPAGPPLPSPGETEPGEPLLPLIVQGDFNGTGYGIDAFFRYHHQLDRIVEYELGLTGSVSDQGRFGVRYNENQFTYRTPENRLNTAGAKLSLNGLINQTDNLSYDFDTTVNLRNEPAPLNRRVQRAQVEVSYHPNCYGIALAYVEEVDVASEYNPNTGQNEDSFFISRRILLTFNIGGVVTTSRGFTLPSGG